MIGIRCARPAARSGCRFLLAINSAPHKIVTDDLPNPFVVKSIGSSLNPGQAGRRGRLTSPTRPVGRLF